MRFHARESMSGAATATIDDNTERPAGILCCVAREFDRLDLYVRVVVSQTELPNYGNVRLPSGTDRAAFQLSPKRHCETARRHTRASCCVGVRTMCTRASSATDDAGTSATRDDWLGYTIQ